MTTLLMFFYFVITLFLLVSVHEFGHFIVARLCGVTVKKFSFGFGKVLCRYRDRKGTEFVWSLFPLGGYVKMLDEEEGDVTDTEKPFAFNNQSTVVKLAIVLAGPLFNLLFAFVAFWLVLVVGIISLAPMVADVVPGSIAAKAHLMPNEEIVAMNGKKIVSWQEFQYVLMSKFSSAKQIKITVKSISDSSLKHVILPLEGWSLDAKNPDVLSSLGIKPFIPKIPPVIGEVTENSPASKVGLRTGDTIISADSVKINDWLELLDIVQKNPGKRIPIVIQREGRDSSFWIKLGELQQEGKTIGTLGVRSKEAKWPKGWLRVQREGVFSAIPKAMHQTVDVTGATFIMLSRFFMGQLPLRGISGPIGIAKGAGDSAKIGFAYYVSFLALISVSLGVINVLPIPLLDGGHAFQYLIEAVIRRNIPGRIKAAYASLGFVLLIMLTILATTNDLSRILN